MTNANTVGPILGSAETDPCEPGLPAAATPVVRPLQLVKGSYLPLVPFGLVKLRAVNHHGAIATHVERGERFLRFIFVGAVATFRVRHVGSPFAVWCQSSWNLVETRERPDHMSSAGAAAT